MSSRFGGALTLPTTDADVVRDDRRRAVRAVCALTDDADVAREVLDVLGLDPGEGLPASRWSSSTGDVDDVTVNHDEGERPTDEDDQGAAGAARHVR